MERKKERERGGQLLAVGTFTYQTFLDPGHLSCFDPAPKMNSPKKPGLFTGTPVYSRIMDHDDCQILEWLIVHNGQYIIRNGLVDIGL